VAARLRREFKAEVDIVGAAYGRFEVVVDGALVLEGGPLAALGVLPSARDVVAALRAIPGDALHLTTASVKEV